MDKPKQIGFGTLLILLVLIALSFFGVDVSQLLPLVLGDDGQPAAVATTAPVERPRTTPGDGDWYDIYFTNPTCPDEELRTEGLDETLAEALLAAESSVDIAAFDFDAEPMIDALIELEDGGLEARIVVDDEHTPADVINRLRGNGLSVVVDDRSALMHNKFIVIDGRYVWTGSMNFADNGVYCNNNNLVRVDSPALAANYTAEMDEMYVDRAFGPRSPVNTEPELSIDGVRVRNYFSPEQEPAAIIGEVINTAEQEVLFMAFSFTHEDVGEPVLERAEAGVDVRGVFENVGSESPYSYYGPLNEAGLDNLQVRQDGNPRIMHHKVFIIDREIVVLGSFNFSGNANDSNDENVLIVYDPAFAQYYVEEFEAVWAEAEEE